MLGDKVIDLIFGALNDEKGDLKKYTDTVVEDSIEVPDEKVQGILDELAQPGGPLDLDTQLKAIYGTEFTAAEGYTTIKTAVGAPLSVATKVVQRTAPNAVTVYIHTFDGKSTPVILKPGGSIQIKTKDGYVCAMVSMDEKPPSTEDAEAAPGGKRIVEV